MKAINQVLLISSVFVLFCATAFAQTFEGTIEFKQTKNGKVTYYVYYVQNHMVRVEQMGENKLINEILIVDTKNKKITLLSPQRESYMEINTVESSKDMTNTRVTMTKDTKTIHGYECKKWVVANAEVGSAVTYWVANDGFDFFVDFLTTVKRKDNIALFFQQVPAAVGYFPLIGEESKIDGSVPLKLEVTKITKKVLRGNFFNIPSGYTKLDN